MSALTASASNRASDWANQKKQAMDKAKKLREERKYNLAMAGEMSVANEMGNGGLARITSSENHTRDFQKPLMNDFLGKKPATMKYGMSLLDQAPSEEELMQARSSLRLLKSKMKDTGGFPEMPTRNIERGGEKQRGYYDEATNEYSANAPGERRLGQDNNFNDVYQNENRNYRKVFKPVFRDDEYQQMNNNLNNELNQIDKSLSRKTNVLNHANNYGAPNDDYQPQSYGSQQPRQRANNSKPPVGMNKYEPPRDKFAPPVNEDFSEFSSKNVPSRIPKNTLNGNKGKAGGFGSNYDDDFGGQPSRQKFGGKATLESESPVSRNYQDKPAYDPNFSQKMPGNSLQKNKFPEVKSNNKGWSNNNNRSDDKEPEDTKAFSKPSFKKNVPAANNSNTVNINTNSDDRRPLKAPQSSAPNEEEYGDSEPLVECPEGCGRKFAEKAVEKHAKICAKVFQTKRKQFNSAQMRATDEQAELSNENKYSGISKKGMQKKQPAGASNSKQSKWKAESEAFRANLKAARGGTLTKEEQDNVAQAASNGFVQCENCGRKFNENAAARHIPYCASKQKIDSVKKGIKARRY